MATQSRAWIEPALFNKRTGRPAPPRTVFYIRYRLRNGKYGPSERAGTDRNYAKKLLKTVQDRLDKQRLGQGDPAQLASDLFEKWVLAARAGLANKKGTKIKESTIDSWRDSLKNLLQRIRTMGEIDVELIKDWKIEMVQKGYADWTIYRRLADAKNWINWCIREKILGSNPFEEIPLSQPDGDPQPYLDDEIESMEAAAEGGKFHLALRLGYMAGMRQSEVLEFDPSRVERQVDGAGLYAIEAGDTKGKKPELLVLVSDIMDLLGNQKISPYHGWTRRKFDLAWVRLKRKAGIKERLNWYDKKYSWSQKGRAGQDVNEDHARFHRLRHTFCKNFLQRGGDMRALKQMTRHKSLAILINNYSRWEIKPLAAVVENLISRKRRLIDLEVSGQLQGKSRPKSDIIRHNAASTDVSGDANEIRDVAEK